MKKALLTLSASFICACSLLPCAAKLATLFSVPESTSLESCALKMVNFTQSFFVYFYTTKSSGGQDIKVIHQVQPRDWTWDWVNDQDDGWQIEICVPNSDGDTKFIAFAFMQDENGDPILYKYTTVTKDPILTPSWDIDQWERTAMTIWFDGWNYHAELYVR